MQVSRTLTLLLLGAGALMAQRVGQATDDLTALSIDDLFSVEVTSVGKKAQQLSKAPAAVHVLTSEDIRRTGATSIPKLSNGYRVLRSITSTDTIG
jgi:iron complex outermembrane receptor protein